jgi:hypothetical protein
LNQLLVVRKKLTKFQLRHPPKPAKSNLPGWSAIILFQRTYHVLTAKTAKKIDFFNFLTNIFFSLSFSQFNIIAL